MFAMRFGLPQKNKVRVIDDCSIGGLNGTVGLPEKLRVHSIDILLNLVVCAFKPHSGREFPTCVGRMFDLKSAYRQFGIDETSRDLLRIVVNTNGKWKANHHVPVWASIRHIDPGRLPPKKLYKSYKTTLQGSVTLHDQHAQQLQTEVERKVQELTGAGNIEEISEQLDQIMITTIAEVYPPDKKEDQRLSQDPQVKLLVKEMWRTYAKYREVKTATFQNIFAKWNQYALP